MSKKKRIQPSKYTPGHSEKQCPKCNKTHTNKSLYCCIACANARVKTKEYNDKVSDSMTLHMASEDSEERRWKVCEEGKLLRARNARPYDQDLAEMTYDDIYVQPMSPKLDHDQLIEGNEIWTLVDD